MMGHDDINGVVLPADNLHEEKQSLIIPLADGREYIVCEDACLPADNSEE
jgi:hypothetical protein